ncbi:MAG: hypothetical protein CL943_00510 [Candidatus Diapherotrites archaeon]|uniref:NodB homology domain-containing protein n=1 Tax=Candidatus Iainarchaeum sp. TaxID=3101447 RepID=A0A2D6M033_9ARCH|nr:hypothetical protein [Candidatus Diapherotrites archaeon]|tara:strand:+ start:9898 stop:11220 length:1323 start_codon:yes stop_codon:yes gene_type:complete
MQSLAIGLVEQSPGWEQLLSQEGLYWKKCDLSKPVSVKQFAVIVVNRKLSEKEQDNLDVFGSTGGEVLHSVETEKKIVSEKIGRKGFRAAGKCLPEQVSKVDKGTVRKEVAKELRRLLAKRRLPYVQKWFFPKKNVLSFHLDVDNDDVDAVQRVLESTKEARLKPTWFVNGKACKEKPVIVSLLEHHNQIIGSHGWEHSVHKLTAQNSASIRKSIDFLKKNGVKSVKGYSSPDGHWNTGLEKAMESNKIDYAVCFAKSFLDLPFEINKTMILGSYPICVGIMKTRDFSERKMKQFFKEAIDNCLDAEIPCLLYGHPSKRMERYPKIINFIADYGRKKGLDIVSLEEYTAWWRKRSGKNFQAFVDKGNLVVKTGNNDSDFKLRVVSDGKQRLMPLKSARVRLKGSSWKKFSEKKTKFTCKGFTRPGVRHIGKRLAGRILGK